MKYEIEFRRFDGKKKIGSTTFELTKEQYIELMDIVKEEIKIGR